MDIVAAIVAGLAGTAVMTALMVVAPKMGMPEMDIIGMLGSMVTANSDRVTLLGTVIHFMMGVLFAIVYALLWSAGIGNPTWIWGLIFGAVHGVIAIISMPVLMRMHPRAPEMESGQLMMGGQLMGHMVFGLVVALVYGAF